MSAVTQLESSKPGCASGDSSACFQFVSAGSAIGCAMGIVPVSPPSGSPAPLTLTGCPFQLTLLAPVNTSIEPSVALSPVSWSGPSAAIVAPRSRCVPRTITGPEAVLCCQKVSAWRCRRSAAAAGLAPGPWTAMRIRPLWV